MEPRTSNDGGPGHEDEANLAGLLREAGTRPEPPEAVRRAVRSAVEAEWRAVAARHRPWQRNWWPAMAAAASLVVVAVLARFILPLEQPAPVPVVATVARVSGPVQVGDGGEAAAGTPLPAGSTLRTGPSGMVAVRLGPGVTLRLDRATTVRFQDPDRVLVAGGRVYVDAEPGPVHRPVVLETAFGTLRHLGTQFQVRVDDRQLRLVVREGRVELTGREPGQRLVAESGEAVEVIPGGNPVRTSVDRTASEWDWIHGVVPTFSIEDRPLHEFLRWVARETGRDLHFGSDPSRLAAERLILRGSVAGLPPEQALAAVMATTTLDYRLAGDNLEVSEKPGNR